MYPAGVDTVTRPHRHCTGFRTAHDERTDGNRIIWLHDVSLLCAHAFAPKLRMRKLLETTKKDEKAIAAPAISGLSRPAAAIGIAATL